MRFIIYVIVVVGISYIVERFLRKKEISDSKKGSAIITTFFITLIFCVSFNIWGTHKYGDHIGNFFEKANYDAGYFVYVSDNPDSTKYYRLKADIRKGVDNYYLLKVYWPNGGSLSFEEARLFVNKASYLTDDNDREWIVELTTHRITNNN